MRYVVLYHEGFGQPHHDVMIESSPGGSLMTWRSPEWPPVAGDELIRIGDHRREYLEYEGPVSNNRGSVRRVTGGTCEIDATESAITMRILDPEPMLVLLRKDGEENWRVVEVD